MQWLIVTVYYDVLWQPVVTVYCILREHIVDVLASVYMETNWWVG